MDSGDNDIVEAGDAIDYQMEISNTGNTCLEDLVVTDLRLGGDSECEGYGAGTATTGSIGFGRVNNPGSCSLKHD